MSTGKGNVHKYNGNRNFEVLPRELLQACDSYKVVKDKKSGDYIRVKKDPQEKILSLQAVGLLCNLQSYPEEWELNKTELYKRYGKHKKTSVSSAWDELVDAGYIIQFRKRIGKKYEYTYYFSIVPFDKDDIKQIEREENAVSRDNLGFRISETQNGKPKMGSPKSAANIKHMDGSTQEDNTQEQNTQSSPDGSLVQDDDEINNNNKGLSASKENKEKKKKQKANDPMTFIRSIINSEKEEWKHLRSLARFLVLKNVDPWDVAAVLTELINQDVLSFTDKSFEDQYLWTHEQSKKPIGISNWHKYFLNGFLGRIKQEPTNKFQDIFEKRDREKKQRAANSATNMPTYDWLNNY